MLLFTIQYIPLVDYEKGVHVLLLSIFILEMKGRWLHSATLCRLSLVLYCLAALLITLYNDLRMNGSDIFAVFFYANCLVFVAHSLTVIKTIDSLVCSTNTLHYALSFTTTSTSEAVFFFSAAISFFSSSTGP